MLRGFPGASTLTPQRTLLNRQISREQIATKGIAVPKTFIGEDWSAKPQHEYNTGNQSTCGDLLGGPQPRTGNTQDVSQ